MSCSSLGVYPVAGSDRWVIGAPLFPRARVTVGDHELVIEAAGSGTHVRAVTFDGTSIDGVYLTQAQLATGHVLHFDMTE